MPVRGLPHLQPQLVVPEEIRAPCGRGKAPTLLTRGNETFVAVDEIDIRVVPDAHPGEYLPGPRIQLLELLYVFTSRNCQRRARQLLYDNLELIDGVAVEPALDGENRAPVGDCPRQRGIHVQRLGKRLPGGIEIAEFLVGRSQVEVCAARLGGPRGHHVQAITRGSPIPHAVIRQRDLVLVTRAQGFALPQPPQDLLGPGVLVRENQDLGVEAEHLGRIRRDLHGLIELQKSRGRIAFAQEVGGPFVVGLCRPEQRGRPIGSQHRCRKSQ